MFKKIFLLISAFFVAQLAVLADDLADVRAFFDSYVTAANSYSKTIPGFYLPNAKIIRVVYKPDGTKVAVPFPMSEYTNQMKKGEKLAKLVRYKNRYTDIQVAKQGNDYKVSAIRIPNNDKSGLPFHFIVTKTPEGYKVKEESMGTTVQDFLKYAK